MSRDAILLVGVICALVVIGLVMLYSATAVTAEQSERHGDATWFLKRQLLWVMLSLVVMAVVSRIPPDRWMRWRWPLLAGAVVLLGLVFVPGVGAEINNARRWVRAGGWFLQPSEAAKIAIAVFLAGFAAADPERLKRLFRGFLPACAVLAVVCGMILVEPDVGTALFIALVMGVTLIVAGVRWSHVLPVLLIGAMAVSWYAVTHTEHVEARLQAWLHPELDPLGKGHQIMQSQIALGNGGLTGTGLGRGVAKLYFLPEAHSDFIFAVLGEELGFLGTSAVVGLYLAVGLLGFRIMMRAPDRFSFLLSFALTAYILVQAAINVAVVTAAVPTKGIPLPLVSAGGSSMLFTMAGVGMLVGVANAAERGSCEQGDRASCLPVEAPAAMSSRA